MVRVLNLPFRTAHHATGAIVAFAEEHGKRLDELSLDEMQAILPDMTEDVMAVLTVDHSVASRVSEGGTAPDNVIAAVALKKKELAKKRV